jgi:hypothetical protein
LTLRSLTPEEGRVIGSLIEKQLTTPLQYPLTLNALVVACNQSSNREPVVSYSNRVVEAAVMSLRDAGLAGFMYPSHGRTVTRYRHMIGERLALDERELALVAALLLRGPQTAGELRSRTDRMAHFDGIGAVDADLERLSQREEPLVLRLERRPGEKEERWVQLLTGPFDQSAAPVPVPTAAPARAAWAPPAPTPTPTAADLGGDGLAALAEQVTSLRDEVAELRAALERLQEQLGG